MSLTVIVGQRFIDLTHARHVCAATLSKVVMGFGHDKHCFFKRSTSEAPNVNDVATSGCECIIQLCRSTSWDAGFVLVYPGWVKCTWGGSRGFNTCRPWKGVTGNSVLGSLARRAQSCRNWDAPVPSQRQWLIAVHSIIPPHRRLVTLKFSRYELIKNMLKYKMIKIIIRNKFNIFKIGNKYDYRTWIIRGGRSKKLWASTLQRSFFHVVFGRLQGWSNCWAVASMKASANTAPSPLQSTWSLWSSSEMLLLLNLPAKG